MAAIVKQEARVVKAGYVEIGEVDHSQVTIKGTGQRVNIPRNIYGETNFYILQSRKYFPNCKFSTYIHFYYIYMFYPLIFFGSFAAPVNFIFAFVMTGVNALFLLLYIQHLHVIRKTMKYVIRQVVVPNHSIALNNDHIEISWEKYTAQYAATSDIQVGFVMKGAGTVQIQVFKKKAMRVMKKSIAVSILCFIGSAMTVLYCPAMGIWVVTGGSAMY